VLSLEQNQPVLGRAVGLSEFLFGSSRAALSLKVSEPLRELQHGRCFYCERSLPAAAAVDHFIPWSRYPRDLAHNLVLAHGACNARKSDLLGGEVYLGALGAVRLGSRCRFAADRHRGGPARRSCDVGRGGRVELWARRARAGRGVARRHRVRAPVGGVAGVAGWRVGESGKLSFTSGCLDRSEVG
jgi:hypothetical protein